ncbi:Retrovirus-related Pol polyprotein from type-1 retrotransposable element R2 [Toxocara canis]|uniref:Retrovirus-related Pol polyprotein from type-1 retrotransposable element R2 n=1 Tax=Toxocara canis TaxID=6265 RepID=A0A0B2VX20_TOXCA|nr:Retrovirus-related Pol polyprotein from type-1 retrotransposable element R2 [Toxocara canis]
MPAAWKKSRTILLMKKGDPENLSNYRPITLLSQIYKSFSRVVLNRITKNLDMFMSREQAGFRRGYSTVDHMHAVRQLVEKCNEFHIPLCLAFVDYKKAFDSVERNAVLNALDKCGVNPNYVDPHGNDHGYQRRERIVSNQEIIHQQNIGWAINGHNDHAIRHHIQRKA